MKPVDLFPRLLDTFFYEWMVQQRNASAHTVRSYRDTWRLFLRFVAERRKQTVARLILTDLTASQVSAFLRYTEQERGDTIGTRSCRLAALRTFFGFVAEREPTANAQCAEILRIPTKKARIHAPCYLEPEEDEAILVQPDRSTIAGPTRSRSVFLSLQHRRPHPGNAQCMSARDSFRFSGVCAPLWQGTKRANLPAVAGDGFTA